MNILKVIIVVVLALAPAPLWITQGLQGYQEMSLPGLAPPAWGLGLIGAGLCLGLAGAGVLTMRGKCRSSYSFLWPLFLAQNLLNFFWPLTFFQNQNIIFALIEALALLVIAGSLSWRWTRIRPQAGIIMIPVLVGIIFIILVNYNFFLLNPRP